MTTGRQSNRTRDPGTDTRNAPGVERLERISRSLGHSAQQVWLAGLGALGRAQSEGTRMFETLVKEGADFESSVRRATDEQVGAVREAVETQVESARTRVGDTWDRLERMVEDRVQRTLVRLGVPRHEDLAELNARVAALTAELQRQREALAAQTPPRKTPARKTPRRNIPAKQAAPRKAASSSAADTGD